MTQPLIYLIKRACSRVQDSRNCDIYKTNAEKKKHLEASLKALSHEAIFSATCNATDDESIARQVAELMLHVAYWSRYFAKSRRPLYFSSNSQHNCEEGCDTCNFVHNVSRKRRCVAKLQKNFTSCNNAFSVTL